MNVKQKFAELRANAAALTKKLSAQERNQLAGALCAVMAIFYGLLVWYPGNKALGELHYQQQKLDARTKHNRTTNPHPGKASTAITLTPLQIEKELQKLSDSSAKTQAELARLGQHFVAFDDPESLQALKSAITRLAEAGDMEVFALEHIIQRKDSSERPPTAELLQEATNSNPFRRPLLKFQARANYRGLMQFLDGLSTLAFTAAPVWLNISAGAAEAAGQRLEVEIHLAI